MCTVLFAASPEDSATHPFVLLGTRDEFTDRPWDPPAAWWPDHPELIGGRDREAGGTWLAVHPAGNRMSVVLNRWEDAEPPAAGWSSRGALPLLAAGSVDVPEELARRMRPFNLLTASASGVTWLAWDGSALTTRTVEPGVHVLGGGGLDEPGDPRVDTWLPRLRGAARPEPLPERAPEQAWEPWLGLLNDSAEQYPVAAGEALVRAHTRGGRRHATLAVCGVALPPAAPATHLRARFDFAELPVPARFPDRLPWARAV